MLHVGHVSNVPGIVKLTLKRDNSSSRLQGRVPSSAGDKLVAVSCELNSREIDRKREPRSRTPSVWTSVANASSFCHDLDSRLRGNDGTGREEDGAGREERREEKRRGEKRRPSVGGFGGVGRPAPNNVKLELTRPRRRLRDRGTHDGTDSLKAELQRKRLARCGEDRRFSVRSAVIMVVIVIMPTIMIMVM